MPQNVLVTGGGDGIGRAIAERFAETDARVHICDVDPDHLADATTANPGMQGSVTDVAEPEEVSALVADAIGWMGSIDVLVNNVGIAGPRAPLEEMSDEARLQTGMM